MPVAERAPQDAYRWALTACATEIHQWRRAVVSVLRDWGADARAMELAAFGVSELLSNVLKHARNPECQLGVTRSGDRVVVQVHDRSARLPKIAEPNWEAECGRGLWLLNEMADALGWTIKSEGKATWFACRLVGSEEVAA